MKAVLVIKAIPGLQQQYLDYLDEYMHNPNPDFHSLRIQPAEHNKPALARELSTEDNEEFETMLSGYVPSFKKLPLSVNHMGMKVPLHGRFVYPFEATSFAPQRGGVDADVPDSYLWDVHSHRPRQLHLYGFEGNTTPQRYAGFDEGRAQPEGIIYGDIDDDLITRFSNKPVTLDNLRYGAMALMPNSLLPLQVEDLNEKQAEAAQLLMDAGVPPLLTQGNGLAGHTPFRQWDAAPERSAIPTEELPYATNPGRVITGEPMDIAFQLLKEDIDYQDEDYIHPHEQIWNDEADEQLVDTTNSLWDYVENMSNDDKIEWLRLQGNPFMQRGMQRMYGDFPELSQQDIDDSIWEMMFDAWQDSQLEMPGGIDFDLGGNRKSGQPRDPTRAYAVHPNHWKKLASEPMNIAFQLLKERVSPEAKRHKLEYDKKYESTPERVKYREELNRERRRRGIYGSHDHKDISHTEGGKLTLEGEHENRARHFKDKGTLREL